MGTKTTNSNQYNGAANATYNAFQPQIMSQLSAMVQNPLGSTYFQNQLAQQKTVANQISQRNQTNSLENLKTGGGILSNAGGYVNSLVNRNNIQGSNLQSNAFNSALNSALQNRNMALMSMQTYQPLQTGSTSSTSGLGTWLPQVAGMAMNMVAPGLGSMMGGGSFSGGYQSQGGGGGYSAPRPAAQSNPWYNNNPGGFPY